jgi:hypothetical protein
LTFRTLSPPEQITAASIANQGTALEIVPPDADTRRQEIQELSLQESLDCFLIWAARE